MFLSPISTLFGRTRTITYGNLYRRFDYYWLFPIRRPRYEVLIWSSGSRSSARRIENASFRIGSISASSFTRSTSTNSPRSVTVSSVTVYSPSAYCSRSFSTTAAGENPRRSRMVSIVSRLSTTISDSSRVFEASSTSGPLYVSRVVFSSFISSLSVLPLSISSLMRSASSVSSKSRCGAS